MTEPNANQDPSGTGAGLAGAAYLRTVFPALWGSLLAWLFAIAAWIPEPIQEWLSSDATQIALSGALAVGWYWVWNKVHSYVPDWLERAAMGSVQRPSYGE